MKIDFKDLIEPIIDNTDDKVVDIIVYVIMAILSISTLYMFISTLTIIKTFIIPIHPMWIYSILFILSMSVFYLSMLGKVTNKPANRPKMFLFTSCVLTLCTYSILAEICNYTITSFIDKLLAVADIPNYLIHTNVRLITVFIPAFIVILVFYKSLSIPFNKVYKKELLEYTIDLFVKNVDKITDYTIDLKICEDITTGKPMIWTEKNAYRHRLIAGSSGSGKTALSIRPDLSQLFYMKARFREKLKELTFEALDQGLCYLKYPITNKYMNESFSMDLIVINEEKKDLFIEKFKDYIIGVRKADRNIYSNVHATGNVAIPIKLNNDIKALEINILVYTEGMVYKEHNYSYDSEIDGSILEEDYKITISSGSLVENNITTVEDNYTECIVINIEHISNKGSTLNFKIDVNEKSEGKIIYRGLGISVIAPDGGLSENACEIAAKNGVTVNKIDPKKEEIAKGNIARFNPLLVGEPEKTGDIISSILVSMEQSGGKDTNPYFTNASIRAVRNLVILLKVMHPKLYNGENPTLSDVLDMLNNFNLVIPYVTRMKEDEKLRVRWKTVIDYFETSFYPPVTDEKGKQLPGISTGSATKKTQEAISGIINQLDNFLGREEIKYILCDRNKSLNLSEVLENGECLAVSTRQSELGDVLGKAFALMIILSMQNAVLCRYSEDENPEIPHYLTIDEFPFYINDQTKVFFTFARKYRCSVTVAVQNLAQLAEDSEVFRETILTNTACKLILPGANVQDREYFCKYLGIEEVFEMQTSVTSNPVVTENAKYSEGMRGTLTEKNKVSEQELAELKFKRCYYAMVDSKGVNRVGKGFIDFMKLTDDNTIVVENYDFVKFIDQEEVISNNDINAANSNENNTERSSSENNSRYKQSISSTMNNINNDPLQGANNTVNNGNSSSSNSDSNISTNVEDLENAVALGWDDSSFGNESNDEGLLGMDNPTGEEVAIDTANNTDRILSNENELILENAMSLNEGILLDIDNMSIGGGIPINIDGTEDSQTTNNSSEYNKSSNFSDSYFKCESHSEVIEEGKKNINTNTLLDSSINIDGNTNTNNDRFDKSSNSKITNEEEKSTSTNTVYVGKRVMANIDTTNVSFDISELDNIDFDCITAYGLRED